MKNINKILGLNEQLLDIALAVIEAYGIKGMKLFDIQANDRTNPLPEIRFVYIYIAKRIYKDMFTANEIMKVICRNKSGLYHAVNQVDNWRKTNKYFAKKYNSIYKYVKNSINK